MSESIIWQRSSHCADNACLEIALRDDEVLIRNNSRPEQVVIATREEWEALVAGVDAGDFRV
ncbi:PHD/YefM family antitoxin component YafN of YafNO toxin-antitoxin module [Actinoplanes lutulentus]|uniref:Uncharacterized protein DUF397 n=1 Tax=Actinoplanes lutulentus TaxID=1287878 RepID=A0A327ZJA9_9ACTN|nr:DUF397 domain-containing protein [Actinoplanes lutulentus]MBB2944028.1 PHD/YefM family antitoxin component YafN of YafNO toxin-antitoxin module [Actinoplanes lutulentus]RAK42739.1 uncharacterized protein DUF397 [Actinoplanes lutulentus]